MVPFCLLLAPRFVTYIRDKKKRRVEPRVYSLVTRTRKFPVYVSVAEKVRNMMVS
jgi:hypothetical protein